MTTPAQDAPLVLPSAVFRPLRLLVICAVLTLTVSITGGMFGRPMVGAFVGIGLLMGLLNALLVRRSVAVITADAHPLKKKMAVNSAGRLLILTVIGLTIAFVFRPDGLAVVFGMALFQVILVASTVVPVWKKLRTFGVESSATPGHPSPGGEGTDGKGTRNE
ncbi:ATP synthase subunit I [Mycobacterium sp. SM1]|uniref:ATP synthase subunit I n=1 Tax=Mycobacterium sp. SM1 TaxID=2816243 RepID=UPI001BCADD40|nr:ATP synthase subunit I [Mycobacterium sp. SM1]MBS4727301.1 ATP synthase subunit I [Mycobacterium sp. SM1]